MYPHPVLHVINRTRLYYRCASSDCNVAQRMRTLHMSNNMARTDHGIIALHYTSPRALMHRYPRGFMSCVLAAAVGNEQTTRFLFSMIWLHSICLHLFVNTIGLT